MSTSVHAIAHSNGSSTIAADILLASSESSGASASAQAFSQPISISEGSNWRPLRRRGTVRLVGEDPPLARLASHNDSSVLARSQPAFGAEVRRIPERQARPKYYTLFCGGSGSQSNHDPQPYNRTSKPTCWSPSPLPGPEPASHWVPPSRTLSSGQSSGNGCGALIHLRGIPKSRLGVYTAKSFVTPSEEDLLAPLDAKYFVDMDMSIGENGSVQFVKGSCGCERIGIGCSLCGNPLGTRFRPCRSATTGSDAAVRDFNARVDGPTGRDYWRISANQVPDASEEARKTNKTLLDNMPDFYVYTFFPSAVTSSPSFDFSGRSSGQSSFEASMGASSSPPSRYQRPPSPSPLQARRTFFVDPLNAPVIDVNSGRSELNMAESRSAAAAGGWGDEWQPPSPVRLTFMDRDAWIPLSGRPASNSRAEELPTRSGRTPNVTTDDDTGDEWDKEVWETRFGGIIGR